MRFIIFFITGITTIFTIIFVMRLPHKEGMESLVMPGLLTTAHARYENQCAQCHTKFDKGNQNSLCLNCHKEVMEDLNTHQGFHGRSGRIHEKQCRECHTEHKGRDFDSVRFERETFDHDLTDFPLAGAHANSRARCDTCHAANKKFREAPKDCFNCHADDDRHKGHLGTNCARCHNETSWKQTYFDHSQTRFLLEGKHKEVTCGACHVNQTYAGAPTACIACHVIDDIHDSPREEKCDRCHSAQGWAEVSFDHNKETKFILQDRHAALKCDSCHPANVLKNNSGSQCIDCHNLGDIHKGKNGNKCNDCHVVAGWKQVTFDHARDTRFKLPGRHAQVQCDACHKASAREVKLETSCYSCHRADDVHNGQQGIKCESCHNENGWREQIRFDHDLTNFPLIGVHAVTSCGECHLSSAYKDAEPACISCHEPDDYHKRTLGTDCARCHNPNGWNLWEFDHNTQTDYKLKDAHEGLECLACHRNPMGKDARVSRSCFDCHEPDDYHKRTLGTDCARCHNPNEWNLWEFNHNTQTDYKLKGAHEGLECRACHRDPMGKNLQVSSSCFDCHEPDDVHSGRFGQQCDLCHVEDSFKKIMMR